jgi:hypothetical protein
LSCRSAHSTAGRNGRIPGYFKEESAHREDQFAGACCVKIRVFCAKKLTKNVKKPCFKNVNKLLTKTAFLRKKCQKSQKSEKSTFLFVILPLFFSLTREKNAFLFNITWKKSGKVAQKLKNLKKGAILSGFSTN